MQNLPLTHSYSHSPAHSLTHLLTHSLTSLLAHSLTCSLTYSLTCSLTHSLTCSLTHSSTHSLTYPTHSLIHFTHLLTQSYPPTHSSLSLPSSNLNSADSSLSSSAFVTPSGSHPSSPPSSPCSSQSTCLSVELLTSSCNRLLQLQQEEEAENGGMTPPSLTESDQHDSGLEENATADVDDLGSVSRRRKDEIASTPTESSTVTSGEDKNKVRHCCIYGEFKPSIAQPNCA